VWDYVGDNFVHRLLQNKTDGKLVEVSSGAGHASQNDDCEKSDEKFDSLQLEFTYMLTTQLESQRSYFEEKLSMSKKEVMKEVQEVKETLLETLKSNRDLDAKLSNVSKEKATLERKLALMNQKYAKALGDLKEEKQVNKCLAEDKQKWEEMVAKLKKQHEEYVQSTSGEISDLKEQLRDIMFFLEAQKLIEESPLQQEITDGQVVVDQSQNPNQPTTSKGARRKKNR
jgi:BRCA1-associated protein